MPRILEKLNDFSDKEYFTYAAWSYYDAMLHGIEDALYTNDFDELEDWVWDKLQHGSYVKVMETEDSNVGGVYDPDKIEFGDEAYGIIDYKVESYKPLTKLKKKVRESADGKDSNIRRIAKDVNDYIIEYEIYSNSEESPDIDEEKMLDGTYDMLLNKNDRDSIIVYLSDALSDYDESDIQFRFLSKLISRIGAIDKER